MTDIQQGVPTPRPAGRGFRAYTAKHLDTLTDLEPVFADRFPFEPARYVAGELPGLFPREPDEPGELMVPAI